MIRKLKYAAASVVVALAAVVGMILFDYDVLDEWADEEN
jgi:hypothetical protein